MIVTVAELKENLHIQYNDEDAYLASLLMQAQAAAEDFCRVTFAAPAPEPVRLAVQLMASFYHEYRDAPDKQAYIAMRMAFEDLIYPYRDAAKMF